MSETRTIDVKEREIMTAALILAAGYIPGAAERKPIDDIGGISPVKRLILIYKQAGIRKIIVVTGFEATALEKHCANMGAIFLHNAEYESGDMLSSVKTGIEYLRDKCEKVFISPVNIPLFSIETVRNMGACDASVVIPMFNNRTGHPLLISAELFERVLEYEGGGGLEGALSGAEVTRKFFDVPDEGIILSAASSGADVINSVSKKHSLRKLRPDVRLRLAGERAFFGPGTLQLLSLTAETGSLKRAARHMGISYSKAIKMIIDIEEQTGVSVLVSKQGGSCGGSSTITEKGLMLMRRYDEFSQKCEKLVNAVFEEHFGDDLFA